MTFADEQRIREILLLIEIDKPLLEHGGCRSITDQENTSLLQVRTSDS